MATPWTFEQRLAAYRAEGITKITVMPNAATHNRDTATGKTHGPVYGLVIHHTAGVGSGMADYCYNGNSSLPGPLCHDFLAKDGTLYVVGHGRTNHAGTTTQAVKDSLLAGRTPNLSDRNVGSETVDANDFMFGLEIENWGNGTDPYPKAQYDVAVRWATAYIRHYKASGWDENNAWGHKEITSRKNDPSFSMTTFRADVKSLLAGGAQTPEEEEVELTPAQLKEIARYVVTGDSGMKGPDGESTWALSSYVQSMYRDLAALVVGGIDYDRLADKVADRLAQRLAD